MRFFELSEYQAHRVLCYCMHGRTVEGRFAANVVRSIAASHLTLLMPLAVLGAMALPTIFFVSHLLMKAT